MEKNTIKTFPITIFILLFMIGCSTTNSGNDNVKKMVREEIKSELKGVHDFLNVAYAYDINPESLENLARMNESIKAIQLDLANLKKTMIKARLGGAGGGNADLLNEELDQKFADLEKKIERMMNEKLARVNDGLENSKLDIKEHQLDIKSNLIDVSNNRAAIRDVARETNENKIALKQQEKALEETKLLLAKDIEKNTNNINIIKQDVQELKKSSAKLMLNINQAK